jgi:two-component system sensor histidine kinase ChvG
MTAGERLGRFWRFLFRIRTRLLLVNVIIVTVPIVGLGFARFYEREMLGALERDMIHQAEVLRAALRDDVEAGPDALAARAPLLRTIAGQTRARIRLVVPPGRVVADSHEDGPPEGVETAPPLAGLRMSGAPPANARRDAEPDLATRPEIQRALAGHYGAKARVWHWPRYLDGALEGERVFLFSALPLPRRDGTIAGAVYLTRSTVPVLASLHRLRGSLINLMLVVVAITTVLSLFLAATIARPLASLLRRAQRVASGARGESLRLDRRDEIGDLSRALDEMARRLDARAAETAALAADISHEFKSPLTGLRGAAELMLEGAGDDPVTRARFLRNMLADTRRLDRLVTRLLELSRLEADTAPPADLDLGEVMVEAAEAAGWDGAAPDGAPVSLRAPGAKVLARGRRGALVAAVRNLVDNARAHAAPGTAVEVGVEAAPDGTVSVSVTNQGPPIPAATLERMWDRFFTTRAERGGTGLGLPIAAAAARAHGGRVTCASTDAGTTFVLTLPRRA